ncbi:MAG TPA: HEAT repeat domain-containing protein [Armatimonadota bacterium]|nr:HEAT repeat domain-containing protein [Armatimonadota bacterium]
MRHIRLTWAVLGAALSLIAAGCSIDRMPRLNERIESEDLQTRTAALIELANLNDPRAVPALTDVFESDEELMDMAAVALVKKGRELKTDQKPDPIIDGIAALANNVHLAERVRARAAWMLGEIGDREAIPALKTASTAKLGSGYPAPAVRTQATEALEKLGYAEKGRAFEVPMGSLAEQEITTLPVPKEIMATE